MEQLKKIFCPTRPILVIIDIDGSFGLLDDL